MRARVKKLLRHYGIEVRRVGLGPRSTPGLVDFLNSRQIDMVLDVGANVGQFGMELRHRGYRGRIVSFEPVQTSFTELQGVAARDGNWTAHHHALGAERGSSIIKVTENSVFSSLLAQTAEAQRFEPTARVLREETVQIERLDDLFERFRGRRVFLKIDTQGFERAVLDGATEALKEILGISAELPVMHLYEGVWSLSESLDYFTQRGFVLSQTTPTGYDTNDRVSVVELDCVFRRITA